MNENRERDEHMKKITQKEVASLAGVSTGTVSRVINNHPLVSTEAKIKVQRAITELGYVPDFGARMLAFGKSRSILLLLLDQEMILPTTWRYELPILQGISDYLKQQQYNLHILMHTIPEARKQNFIERILLNNPVDGLIIISSWTIPKQTLNRLRSLNIPYAFVGNGPYPYMDKFKNELCVTFNNKEVTKHIIKDLVARGHRQIAYIRGTAEQVHNEMRYSGYLESLQEFGITFNETFTYQGDYSVKAGYEGFHYLNSLSERPSAIVCANDYMAIGAIKAAHELSLKIPDDYSIVGFDDSDVSEFLSVPLNTVKVPLYEIGSLTAQNTINTIEGSDYSPLNIIISTYVKRCSVKDL